MAPMHNAQVLISVPEHKKAVICLIEEISMLDQPYLGTSYSAIGHNFHVHESTVWYT